MKMDARSLMKAALLIPMAGLMMGNQSCEQKPKGRGLKKIVDLGRIQSPILQVPGGASFDFAFVAGQQAQGVLMESDGFAFRYNPPLTTTTTGVQLSLSEKDRSAFMKVTAKDSNPFIHWSTEASCFVYLPQTRIHGSINAFEMVGGGGLTIGFNPSGPMTPTLGSLGFQLEFAQMDLSMFAVHPITSSIMASALINSTQTKTNINATINLGVFSLGPSFYYQTPLASVTKKGLQKAVAELKSELDSSEWYTRVLANQDTHLTIVGGENLGLKKGDQLVVYNETYYWDGEPCASTYRGGGSDRPIALIELEFAGDEISTGKVIKQLDENAVIGAKVKLYKTVDSAQPSSSADLSGLTDVGTNTLAAK